MMMDKVHVQCSYSIAGLGLGLVTIFHGNDCVRYHIVTMPKKITEPKVCFHMVCFTEPEKFPY